MKNNTPSICPWSVTATQPETPCAADFEPATCAKVLSHPAARHRETCVFAETGHTQSLPTTWSAAMVAQGPGMERSSRRLVSGVGPYKSETPGDPSVSEEVRALTREETQARRTSKSQDKMLKAPFRGLVESPASLISSGIASATWLKITSTRSLDLGLCCLPDPHPPESRR